MIIAIAVTFAVALSLFVSVSVIPMFSKQLFALSRRKQQAAHSRSYMGAIGIMIEKGVMALVHVTTRNWMTRGRDRAAVQHHFDLRRHFVDAENGVSAPGQSKPDYQYSDSAPRAFF